ncbi:MAG: WYL domain-containing protein [Rhodocyclaceae bacterium]|nr:WYL domain-containing protein [Rhodocyclaceae bacterium]
MLVKLNQGGKLDPQALAEEFGVNLRTIQRDLNVRFAYLPLQKTDGRYHLDPAFLGKLSTRDIERFASLAGVRGLFPSLSDDFLRDIFDARIQTALLVKGHHYEDLAGKEEAFRQLELAIVSRRHVSFDYRKGDGNKSYASIEPFKLMNQKGIWYLAARDCDKLKTFAFTKIERLRVLDSQFEPDADIEMRLTGEDGIWMGEEQKEIVLKISREVASYFKRRRLIANQVVEKELEDGGLIVSAKVGHPNQVLPIVRYWIPHIHIISPEGLQSELDQELAEYITRPVRNTSDQ